MSMSLDLRNSIIEFCAENKLQVSHAVDLHYKLREALEWDEQEAASDEIKNALISMKIQREYLYGLSYSKIEKWINAL